MGHRVESPSDQETAAWSQILKEMDREWERGRQGVGRGGKRGYRCAEERTEVRWKERVSMTNRFIDHGKQECVCVPHLFHQSVRCCPLSLGTETRGTHRSPGRPCPMPGTHLENTPGRGACQRGRAAAQTPQGRSRLKPWAGGAGESGLGGPCLGRAGQAGPLPGAVAAAGVSPPQQTASPAGVWTSGQTSPLRRT